MLSPLKIQSQQNKCRSSLLIVFKQLEFSPILPRRLNGTYIDDIANLGKSSLLPDNDPLPSKIKNTIPNPPSQRSKRRFFRVPLLLRSLASQYVPPQPCPHILPNQDIIYPPECETRAHCKREKRKRSILDSP